MCLPTAPLPAALERVIEEWFCLVDEDGSGSVSQEELEQTFLVRAAPSPLMPGETVSERRDDLVWTLPGVVENA